MFRDGIVDATKYPNIGSQLSVEKLLNRVVRIVLGENDLRSTKRTATAIQFFDEEYDYVCPSDMKDTALIDIIPQKPRKPRAVLSSAWLGSLRREIYTVLAGPLRLARALGSSDSMTER